MTAVPHDTTDILISGGGVAGLTAAAAFGTAGFRVICVDPEPPVTDASDARAPPRPFAGGAASHRIVTRAASPARS